MTTLRMYTDGACSGNQSEKNFGGWGAILEFGEHRKELHGGEKDTTNNRMELMAVIQAFSALKRTGLDVEMFSDSSYVMNCFRNGWYKNWEKNGWKTSQKKPVENQELWKQLLALVRQHHVQFFRVKGHVNIDSPAINKQKLYQKFVSWNGTRFTTEDFEYVTKMNNRADELANMGTDEAKLRG
ncbi:MAG: ribonuclease HI [Eubacterium sp.]